MKILCQNEQKLGIIMSDLILGFFLLLRFWNWLQQLQFFILRKRNRYNIQYFVIYREILHELKLLLSLFILVFFTQGELNQFFLLIFVIHEFIVDSKDPNVIGLSKNNVWFSFELWLINCIDSWVYLIHVLLN